VFSLFLQKFCLGGKLINIFIQRQFFENSLLVKTISDIYLTKLTFLFFPLQISVYYIMHSHSLKVDELLLITAVVFQYVRRYFEREVKGKIVNKFTFRSKEKTVQFEMEKGLRGEKTHLAQFNKVFTILK
jgi:hypothetical protein